MGILSARQQLYAELGNIYHRVHIARAYAVETHQRGTADDLEQLAAEIIRVRSSVFAPPSERVHKGQLSIATDDQGTHVRPAAS